MSSVSGETRHWKDSTKIVCAKEAQGQDHRVAWLGRDLEMSPRSSPPDVDQITCPGKARTDTGQQQTAQGRRELLGTEVGCRDSDGRAAVGWKPEVSGPRPTLSQTQIHVQSLCLHSPTGTVLLEAKH